MTHPDLPPIPKPLRQGIGAVCAAIAASALAGAAAAVALGRFVPGQPPNWMLLGLELVVLVSAAFGLALARGRYREAPGLALALVAGGVFACSVLGYKAAAGNIGSFPLKLPLLARAAACGLLGLAAAHVVLVRHARAWPIAIKGTLLAAPFVLVVGVGVLSTRIARLSSLLDVFAGWPTWAQALGGLLLIAVTGIAFCAGVHLIIKAFELGRLEGSEPVETAPSRA